MHLKHVYKRTACAVLNLFYPPLCVHCGDVLNVRGPLFCSPCLEQLSLADCQGRCRTCFRELRKGGCDRCMHRKVVIHRQIAACDPMGPALSLLRGINNGRKECVLAAASLMAYQWLEQKMLLPEMIIPFPTSFFHKQKIGFDPKLMLAKELGRILGSPVLEVLKRKWDVKHYLAHGDFRSEIYPNARNAGKVCDKRLLIVLPQLDDEESRNIGIALQPYFPTQIDVLVLAAEVE